MKSRPEFSRYPETISRRKWERQFAIVTYEAMKRDGTSPTHDGSRPGHFATFDSWNPRPESCDLEREDRRQRQAGIEGQEPAGTRCAEKSFATRRHAGVASAKLS